MIKETKKANQCKRDIPLQIRIKERMMLQSIASKASSSLRDSCVYKVKEEQLIVTRPN